MACSGRLPITRGVGLHACFASGNIRPSLIDAAQADVTVGARGSGGPRLAILLRVCKVRKTHQQYCDDPRGPMCHEFRPTRAGAGFLPRKIIHQGEDGSNAGRYGRPGTPLTLFIDKAQQGSWIIDANS